MAVRDGLKFFNLDLHVSVIEDVKRIFELLFPNIQVVDWSISGHAHLFPHAITQPNRVLSHHNWRSFDMMTVRHFHNEYDGLLRQFDGFVVTHTPIFVMLYERYNKPILLVNSCRYHQPICWTKDECMLRHFHDCLARLDAKGLLTIVHNNVADMLFFNRHSRLVLGCSQYYVPSLCSYVQSSYNPVHSTIMVDDRHRLLSTCGFPYNWTTAIGKYVFPLVDKPPSGYEWCQLYEHQAVLLIPTETSFMTFFEYLYAAIPVLLPSQSLLQSWVREGCLTMTTLQAYDMQSEEALVDDWIPYADYYHNEEVQHAMLYFDSLHDLHRTLTHPQLPQILEQKHRVLMECRRRRSMAICRAWTNIIHFDYFQFVCYNFWPCLADFHLDVDYANEPLCTPFYRYNPLDPTQIKAGDLIFVKTDLLSHFMRAIRPTLHVPFRLLIAVSDMTPSHTHVDMLLSDELCTTIYATNMVRSHAKIVPLPIGFAEPLRPNGDVAFLRKRYHEAWRTRKDIDLFVRNFRGTHFGRAEKLKRLNEVYGPRGRFETIVRVQDDISHTEMHGYLGRAKFALCLPGNGIDTHYFYECILNECVPLVWHDSDMPNFPLYAHFPCIEFVEPESVVIQGFYETIDWDKEKEKLLRLHYKYLKSY